MNKLIQTKAFIVALTLLCAAFTLNAALTEDELAGITVSNGQGPQTSGLAVYFHGVKIDGVPSGVKVRAQYFVGESADALEPNNSYEFTATSSQFWGTYQLYGLCPGFGKTYYFQVRFFNAEDDMLLGQTTVESRQVQASGQFSWTGNAGDGDYFNPENWSKSGGIGVLYPSGGPVTVGISKSATILITNDVVISGGGYMTPLVAGIDVVFKGVRKPDGTLPKFVISASNGYRNANVQNASLTIDNLDFEIQCSCGLVPTSGAFVITNSATLTLSQPVSESASMATFKVVDNSKVIAKNNFYFMGATNIFENSTLSVAKGCAYYPRGKLSNGITEGIAPNVLIIRGTNTVLTVDSIRAEVSDGSIMDIIFDLPKDGYMTTPIIQNSGTTTKFASGSPHKIRLSVNQDSRYGFSSGRTARQLLIDASVGTKGIEDSVFETGVVQNALTDKFYFTDASGKEKITAEEGDEITYSQLWYKAKGKGGTKIVIW